MKERWIGHAEPPEPPERVRDAIVAKVFGTTEVELTRLPGGFRHHNYRVHMQAGDMGTDLLLRIYEGGLALVEHDAEIAKCVPVRTPHFLGVGEADGCAFGLREFFVGAPMHEWLVGIRQRSQEVDDTALQSYRRVAREIGKILAAIHARKYDRFGEIDGRLRFVRPFPASSLPDFIEECAARAPLSDRLGAPRLERLSSFAREQEPRLRSWSAPRLVHGDFGPTNIVVGPREELGVLDWEFACAATPAMDFGNLLRGELGTSPQFVSELEEGYLICGGDLPADWQTLAKLVDLLAWVEMAARDRAPKIVIEDARRVIDDTIATVESA